MVELGLLTVIFLVIFWVHLKRATASSLSGIIRYMSLAKWVSIGGSVVVAGIQAASTVCFAPSHSGGEGLWVTVLTGLAFLTGYCFTVLALSLEINRVLARSYRAGETVRDAGVSSAVAAWVERMAWLHKVLFRLRRVEMKEVLARVCGSCVGDRAAPK